MRTSIKDVVLLAAESNFGQEGSTYVNFNFINEGSVEIGEGLKLEKGIGGVIAVHGFIVPSLSLGGLLGADDITLLNNHLPATGFIPKSFSVKAGNYDLGFGVKLLGCIPSEIEVSGKAGDPIKFSIKYEVMKAELLAEVPQPPTISRTGVLMWHDGVVTINNNSYQVSEFKFSMKQEIHLQGDFSPKSTGLKRVRNLVGWGLPEWEVSAKIYLPFPTDLAVDQPSPVDVVIVLGNTTYTFNDLWVEKRSFPVKGGDDIWVMDLTLKGHESCLTIS